MKFVQTYSLDDIHMEERIEIPKLLLVKKILEQRNNFDFNNSNHSHLLLQFLNREAFENILFLSGNRKHALRGVSI